jgi:ABC-type bacteriocin/lantibiotic exporter with double-glycine peptidase domain
MSQYSNNEANRGVAESNKRLNTDPKPTQKPPKVERLRAVLPEVWTLMRPRRGLLALGFILMVINRVAGLVLPYSSRFLIDTVITKHHMEKLRPLVLVVLAATLIQGVTSFC